MVSAPFKIFENKNNSCPLGNKMALFLLQMVGLWVRLNSFFKMCGGKK
jgi:hypothetical protein